MQRPSRDDMMMCIAAVCALRSTCRRRNVGAVIADHNGRVLGTGYNGVPQNLQHCTDRECLGAQAKSGTALDSCWAIHAEMNAITHCTSIANAHTLYTTTQPCMSCMKALVSTNITEIVYFEPYPHMEAVEFWVSTGRFIRRYDNSTFYAALRLAAADLFSELNQREDFIH